MINKKKYAIQFMTDNIESFSLNILKKIGLKKLANWYLKHQEGMRYLIFGGLSTLLNILIFTVLYNVGIKTLFSNFIAWFISVLFAYITNKMCVFNSPLTNKKDLLLEIFSFLKYRILTLIIDEIIMYVFIDILFMNSLCIKIVSNIEVIILNYLFSKLIIFKPNLSSNQLK